MVELNNKEHLVYYMVSNLRLSRYDIRFLQNLEKIIVDKKRITSNQVGLVEKLIEKYERQFIKNQLFISELLKLPWKTLVVETTEEYTSAHIGILDDNIILKTPYNKLFIASFRSLSQSSFIWDNENKYYIADLSTFSLKLAINIATKFFTEVRYSDNVRKLLDQLQYYNDVKYWEPTLVNSNGNYIIACSNSALDNSIQHIKLNTELTTLAELVRYGIQIDENILLTDEERFAGSYNPKVELSNICDIVPWLQNIKCDYVSVTGVGISTSVKFKIEFKQALERAGIKYSDTVRFVGPEHVKQYKFPVIVKFKLISDFTEPTQMAKVINIVNSQPVNLEKNETM
jgi:hypothetical protein